MRVLSLLLIPALLAFPQAPEKKSAKDRATLEAYVRHLFVWTQQIKVDISGPKAAPLPGFAEYTVTGSMGQSKRDYSFYISEDGQRIVQGVVYDVAANPFKNEIDKIGTLDQPNFGTPGASVVVVIFSDFQCPYCKEEAKMLRSNLTSSYPKEVRTYFKDFPLDQIHKWARPASIAGRCVYSQKSAAFWEYHDWIFEQQDKVKDEAGLRTMVLDWAKPKGLDTVAMAGCIDKKTTAAEVDRNAADGRAAGVDSTPTVFVNGRRIPGNVSWPNLRQVIDFEIEYQKTARNAGEDCGCSVTLPSVLPTGSNSPALK